MSIGLMGHKCGMTRVFTEDGASIPVTVVEVPDHYLVDFIKQETRGYDAVKLASGEIKQSKISSSQAGVCKKAGIPAAKYTTEYRVDAKFDVFADAEIGQAIAIDKLFFEGQFVDVTGTSKGKGFAGGVKRHGFKMQDATHGNSLSHRAPGSIGQCQTPGRVFKGKKMAGHMGDRRCTVQNQRVVRIDLERKLLLISGAIPGAPGGKVTIRPAIKKLKKNEKLKKKGEQ